MSKRSHKKYRHILSLPSIKERVEAGKAKLSLIDKWKEAVKEILAGTLNNQVGNANSEEMREKIIQATVQTVASIKQEAEATIADTKTVITKYIEDQPDYLKDQ
jgi:hypothetical protein